MATGEGITSEENVKLLIAVIQHMEGKVDWKAVAEACGIISGPAANKRYSRLLKAHNASPGNGKATASKNGPKTAAKGDNVQTPGSGDSDGGDHVGTPPQGQGQKRKAGEQVKDTKQGKRVKQEQIQVEEEVAGADDLGGEKQVEVEA